MKKFFLNRKIKRTVAEIKRRSADLRQLTNVALQEETTRLRQTLAHQLRDFTQKIAENREIIEQSYRKDPLATERAYLTIKEVEGKKRKEEEKILAQLLPEAYAVLWETMRRFAEEENLHFPPGAAAAKVVNALRLFFPDLEDTDLTAPLALHTQWPVRSQLLKWNMIPYDTQLEAAIHLHQGKLVEMGNGEGKTLAALFPAYLNALAGRRVHIVTANDYLALRDAEWMGPILAFHGMQVAAIHMGRAHSSLRRLTYQADVLYSEINELGFDYLRDNMVTNLDDRMENPFEYIIVDEVDAILIDEARTPLIISGPDPSRAKLSAEFTRQAPAAATFCQHAQQEAQQILAAAKSALATNNLNDCARYLLKIQLMFPNHPEANRLLEQKQLIYRVERLKKQLTSLYDIYDFQEELLFTQEGRDIKLTERGRQHLAKLLEEEDFWSLPDLAAISRDIEQRPISRYEEKKRKTEANDYFKFRQARQQIAKQLVKAYLLFQRGREYNVVEGEVTIIDTNTGRYLPGRRYSDGLHQALEAKEGCKVADATQTYATVTLQGLINKYNKVAGMSGSIQSCSRELQIIYDLHTVIISPTKASQRLDLPDQILRTKREMVNAVVEEVIRQYHNDRPVLLCVLDEYESERFSRLLSLRGIPHDVLNASNHQREAEIIAQAGQVGRIVISAKMAGRGTDIKLSPAAVAKGGLAVIVACRNDARRHDNQLRGRAGRQGLPGSSQFFISLEDSLMRLFNSERIARLMDSIGHTEGEIIEHRMIDRSVLRAQRKVEENAAGVRSRLYEYDNSLHISREIIYERRRNALHRNRVYLDVRIMFEDVCRRLVRRYRDNFQEFCLHFQYVFGYPMPYPEEEFRQRKFAQELFRFTYEKQYLHKVAKFNKMVLPSVLNVKNQHENRYKRILLPLEARGRNFSTTADIESAIRSEAGNSIWEDVEGTITLAVLDEHWKIFLKENDLLKEQVTMEAELHKTDALEVFKKLFVSKEEALIEALEEDTVSYLAQARFTIKEPEEPSPAAEDPKEESAAASEYTTADPPPSEEEEEEEAPPEPPTNPRATPRTPETTFKRSMQKIGRNDPCPCGSGKHYKRCHGA